MPYSEAEARDLILQAGLRLVKEKLIARTWGNISARISENRFVITPSGLNYESLRPEDLTVVDIDTLQWQGKNKPSSEKALHAEAYKLRKDVDFIIHTHQFYASAVSVSGRDTSFAPCSGYGLPGTKKLKKETALSIKNNPNSNSFLMKRHGALCLGKDYEDAFCLASVLEKNSLELFEDETKGRVRKTIRRPYLDDYAQIMGFWGKVPDNEDKETLDLIIAKNDAAALFSNYRHCMNFIDVTLQHLVYRKKYSKLRGKE